MDIFSKLGFDLSSLILYIVNIGILLGALSYILYPKILHFLDERRKLIADSIQQANDLKDAFQKKMSEIEREKELTQKAMKIEVDALRVVIDARREELMKEIEAERFRMFDEVQKQIDAKKERMFQEAEEHMLGVIKKIVIQIVQSKVPEEVIQLSIAESWSQHKKNLS